MKRRLMAVTMFLVLVFGVGGVASALPILTSTGTTQDVSSVTDLVTSGVNSVSPGLPNMLGLQVTATFANGTIDTLSWAVPPPFPYDYSGSNYAGVASTHFSLVASGNTYAALWQFTGGSSAITSLSFAGIPSNIAFDRSLPSPGTAGSAAGQDFLVDTNGDGFADDPAGWTVTYSDEITLNGAPAVGDLYGTLAISFGTGYSGNFSFLQDTDSFVPSSSHGGGSDGGPASVPEPSTMMLLGSGLVGLVGFGRRLLKKS